MPKLKYIAALLMVLSFLLPTATLAGPLSGAQNLLKNAVGGSDIGFEANLASSAGVVVAAALSLVGTIFLILTIYAGILWMTAGGKEEQIEKARKIVTTAVIGLFITLAAYAITTFVTTKLGASGGPTTVCADFGESIKGTCKKQNECNVASGEKVTIYTECDAKGQVCCYKD